MVLQYKFGQIVFRMVHIKKSYPLEILLFYVEVAHGEQLATECYLIFSCGEALLNNCQMVSVCLCVTQNVVNTITQKRLHGFHRPFKESCIGSWPRTD